MTNLNQATAYALEWGSSDFDENYFAHSTATNKERLVVKSAGDYLNRCYATDDDDCAEQYSSA